MNWNELEPKVNRLQDGLLMTMEKIESLSKEEPQLPQPEGNFEVAKKILENREYDVVVCGEVKKGKSSFINAIIGQQLLPVDSDIATCQVFRLSNSTDGKEHFRLVFTDGTSKSISRDELSRYGSQVDVNLNGSPELGGKNLDYIQVEVSAAFLPQGVSIVDTPGLGALYKSHETITQNYIRKAAAVVFVLDYNKPIVELERQFIEKVMEVTPYILFVITKSDRYVKADKDKIISRNNEILKEIYTAKNLTAPKIYPISSLMLHHASHEEDEDERQESLDDSGFEVVEAELMKMIYRAVGLLRTDNAMSVSVNYVNNVQKFICELLKACKDDEQAICMRVAAERQRLQQEFQNENGCIARKSKEVIQEVSAICQSATNRVGQIFQNSSDLVVSAFSSIDSISSTDEAETLIKTLPKSITNEVEAKWEEISEDIRLQVASVLEEINITIDSVYTGGLSSSYGIDAPSLNRNEKIGVATRGYMGMGMGSFLGGAIGGAVGLLFGPVGAAIGSTIGATLAGSAGAFAMSSHAGLEQIKTNIKNQLNKMFNSMRSDLLDVHSGRYSTVGEFSHQLLVAANEALEGSIEKRKIAIQTELEEIENTSKMDIEEKKEEYKHLNDVKAHWDQQTDSLRQLISDRKEIVESFK